VLDYMDCVPYDSSQHFCFTDDTKCFMKTKRFLEDFLSVSDWSRNNNLTFTIPSDVPRLRVVMVRTDRVGSRIVV